MPYKFKVAVKTKYLQNMKRAILLEELTAIQSQNFNMFVIFDT